MFHPSLSKCLCIRNVLKEKMQQIKLKRDLVTWKQNLSWHPVTSHSFVSIYQWIPSPFFNVRETRHVWYFCQNFSAYLNKPRESCQPESLHIETICIAYIQHIHNSVICPQSLMLWLDVVSLVLLSSLYGAVLHAGFRHMGITLHYYADVPVQICKISVLHHNCTFCCV